MKIVLLSLFYLVGLSAWAGENDSCTSNYYEVNGKRTCLFLIGTVNENTNSKSVITKSSKSVTVPDDEGDNDLNLQAIDPNVSDPGPDPR